MIWIFSNQCFKNNNRVVQDIIGEEKEDIYYMLDFSESLSKLKDQ